MGWQGGAECHPWHGKICKKSGKIGKREEKSGRKAKNQKGSFTFLSWLCYCFDILIILSPSHAIHLISFFDHLLSSYLIFIVLFFTILSLLLFETFLLQKREGGLKLSAPLLRRPCWGQTHQLVKNKTCFLYRFLKESFFKFLIGKLIYFTLYLLFSARHKITERKKPF